MQHDVVLAVHPAANALPDRLGQVGPGSFLRGEHEDHRKHRGYSASSEHGGGLVSGGAR